MTEASPQDIQSVPASPTIEELAAAAGATDLFLFRQVEQRSFAHIGGIGRGASWAGIIEIGLDEEPVFADAIESGAVKRDYRPQPWHVFGPYYSRAAAVVPVRDDVVAVFGSADARLVEIDEADLRELATFASESISEVATSKRLADELEVVNAIRDLLRLPAGTFNETLQRVVEHVRRALSCELGVLFTRHPERIAVSNTTGSPTLRPDELREVMDTLTTRHDFPLCIQDALCNELPVPLSAADGVIAYYLLDLPEPVAGVLLLVHTKAAPRGFTLLCQSLGLRLVDAAGALFDTALARDALREELARSTEEARRDTLTGLANRLAWNEAMARLTSSGRTASIIQLDCRGLKNANDKHGHDVGDRLLRRFAEIIATSVRHNDLVARIGGDEFAILLPNTNEVVTQAIIERIEAALGDEPPIESITIAAAIGTATTRNGNLASAQKRADTRMLEAKRLSPLH